MERLGAVPNLRTLVTAFAVACVLITFFAPQVQAQSWNSVTTSGLTAIDSSFLDGAYTWVVHNNSGLPQDADTSYDILIWEIIPFFIQEPSQWSAPEGWVWTGERWKLADKNRKYYTPCSIGPGQKAEFWYKPDPAGRVLYPKGAIPSQPTEIAFIAHVGAVVSNSGSTDASKAWIPATTEYGSTWFDRAQVQASNPVPEPQGVVGLLFGIAGLCLFCYRRKAS